jgi:hypothetical protein
MTLKTALRTRGNGRPDALIARHRTRKPATKSLEKPISAISKPMPADAVGVTATKPS